MKCLICGKFSLIHKYCRSCRKKIPSGFKGNLLETVAEINRNMDIKRQFHKTTGIGKLDFDTDNNFFYIDRGYFSVGDLEAYSFYSSEARYQWGLFGHKEVHADVYFSYTLKGQERRIRKLKTSICKYESTGRAVYIDPPLDMMNAKMIMRDMIKNEYNRMVDRISIIEKIKEKYASESNGY